jgi:nucleoside-diphosphate-sugar epimerase
MILLIGAAGKTGSLAARNLAAHGHRLRALVRDPRPPRRGPGPGSIASTATCATLPRCGQPSAVSTWPASLPPHPT